MSAAAKIAPTRRPRHRPSEPIGPRPSDFISDRFAALAAWMLRRSIRVEIDGTSYDGRALTEIGMSHAHFEHELRTCFQLFRQSWMEHTTRTRQNETLLLRVVEALPKDLDAEGRVAVRMARLRRPPLAKVRALVRPG